MLAERLVDDYDVDVFTTCVRDYATGVNELAEGIVQINGVCVHRFKVAPVEGESHRLYAKKEKPARKWRRFLFRLGLLKYLGSIHPVWNCKEKEEMKAFLSSPFYSPDMRRFVQEHKHEYKVFIPVNMAESVTFFTALDVPEKTLLIPTLHNQGIFFKALHTRIMTKVAYIGFNTASEQKLAECMFGNKMAPHGIISVGIEEPLAASWEETQQKYHLPENYLLYVGRVDPNKMGKIFSYFVSYKANYPESTLHLVLVGGIHFPHLPFEREDVIYTGFVSDEEKMVILQHACVVVNPSKFESLSLILLEAMSQGKLMLVNGECDVLKEHCVKSEAAFYYTGRKDFVSRLHQLEKVSVQTESMKQKAICYVRDNYDWSIILKRLKTAIESIK
ncbi:glycosyltransferase [gut metagenome]|uniref:Glycosyltransferase n=1 Tax=gut metagenome TaxID=749906 RepID=J9H190_9ZZZZ